MGRIDPIADRKRSSTFLTTRRGLRDHCHASGSIYRSETLRYAFLLPFLVQDQYADDKGAQEHWSAVLGAVKDKLDLSIAIAVGSSIQIAYVCSSRGVLGI